MIGAIQWLPYLLGLIADKVWEMVIKAVIVQKHSFNVQGC